MHTIIFTSANHICANALLGMLLRRGVFDGHDLLVLEQHGLVPGKSRIAGLMRYLRVSGATYVCWQIAKQLMFQCVRGVSSLLGRTKSLYYPYWRLAHPSLTRRTCPPLSSDEAAALVSAFHPDLILSLFSKDMIAKRIFSLPPLGCVNLHPAPLPWYRGVSPTFWILAAGDERAGVTLHVVDEGYDTGSIIGQRLFSTKGVTSEHALYLKATRYGAHLVADFVRSATRRRAKKMKRIPNPKEGSYMSLPTREAVRAFLARGYRFFTLAEFFRL